jgi:hypothetical protein
MSKRWRSKSAARVKTPAAKNPPTRWVRPSIAGLMAVVLVSALCVAGLRGASDLWAGVILVLSVGITVSFFALALKAGEPLPFCIAFGIFAAAYLVYSLTPWLGPRIAPHLPTTGWLERLHPLICLDRQESVSFPRDRFDESFSTWAADHPGIGPSMVLDNRDSFIISFNWRSPTLDPFIRIGHCLLALILGFVAGLLAHAVARFFKWSDIGASGS